jgi:hypothetical protein
MNSAGSLLISVGIEYGVPNGGPLSVPTSFFLVFCRFVDRMAETTQKHGFSRVFAIDAEPLV